MHRLHATAFGSLFCFAALAAQDKDRLYTVTSNDDVIRQVDPVTWMTATSATMTAAGFTVRAANGLAVHPTTAELYLVFQVSGGSGRLLGKVDPATGVITVIGNLGQQFAGIAFGATGTLYGVTGDGATTPETLFTIDVNTAVPTQLLSLGNGDDGETICVHPDGRILHASGLSQVVFESIDPGTLQVSNIPLSGDPWSELLSLCHLAGRNFLGVDLNDDVFVITDGGLANNIGIIDHSFVKGLAFVPAGNAASFRVYGEGCPATGGYVPILVGSGGPAPGASVVFGIANGPGGSPAVLSIGSGNGTFNLTPTCVLQNMPIFPAPIIPMSLGGTAPGDGTATLPVTIPASMQPVDLFFQAVVVELASLNLIVTNPLVTRIR